MPILEGEKYVKDNKGLPYGFDAEQLELPILACALKTYGVTIDMPAEILCFGKISRRKRKSHISGYPLESKGLNIKFMPDRRVTEVSYEEHEIVDHLAGFAKARSVQPRLRGGAARPRRRECGYRPGESRSLSWVPVPHLTSYVK